MKAATDFELFQNTSKLDEELEILRLQTAAKTLDMKGFDDASNAFGDVSIEKGLAHVCEGRRDALQSEIDSAAKMNELIKQRWDSLRKYQEDYHARYTEPGNAHNYGERATLQLAVLTTLMQEALARALAFQIGVKIIYGADLAAPPQELTLLNFDEFAIWALKALRQLGMAADQEETAEVVFPLVQPWFESSTSLIDETTFNRLIADGGGKPITLAFDIPRDGVLDVSTRLKAIGLSFGNRFNAGDSGIDRNQTADAFTRLYVKIFTPDQTDGKGAAYARPPVLLGNVSLHGAGSAVAMADGSTVENLCPFGRWQVEIHPRAVWKDAEVRGINSTLHSDAIRDLKITLKTFIPGKMQPSSAV
jgi:hypothetical protein